MPTATCGGACPRPGEVCGEQPGAPAGEECACVAPPPSTDPTPDTTTTTTPTTTTTVPADSCALDTEQSPPVCGGECPAGQICRAFLDGGCSCVPTTEICRGVETSSGTMCLGLCPSPNDRCGKLEPEAPCTCIRFENPCRTDDSGELPVCSGDCPPDEACMAPFGAGCACFPSDTACQPLPDPIICGGRCPSPAQGCFIPAGATSCTCAVPPPCGLDATKNPPACLGVCEESGTICLANEEGDCTCQPLSAFCRPLDGVCGGACGSPEKACESVTVDGVEGCQCKEPDE